VFKKIFENLLPNSYKVLLNEKTHVPHQNKCELYNFVPLFKCRSPGINDLYFVSSGQIASRLPITNGILFLHVALSKPKSLLFCGLEFPFVAPFLPAFNHHHSNGCKKLQR